MYSSLMMFALQVHREQLSYVDVVLAGCAGALASRGVVSEPKVINTALRFFVAQKPLAGYEAARQLAHGTAGRIQRRARFVPEQLPPGTLLSTPSTIPLSTL